MKPLNQNGFSIPLLMAGAFIGAMVISAASSLLILTNKLSTSVSSASDLEQVRLHILGAIDCERTLNPTNTNYTGTPPGCATSPLILRNGRNQLVAPHNGTNHLLHGWTLETDCSPLNELRVRATKRKGATFVIDPYTRLPFDLNHPRATIFSGPTGLCRPSFKSSTAPPGTVLYHVSVQTPCSGFGALPYHYYSTTPVNYNGTPCTIDRNDNAFCREISGIPGATFNKHICRPSARIYVDNPFSPWNTFSFTPWPSCTKVSGTSSPGWDWGRYSCRDMTVSTQVGKLK